MTALTVIKAWSPPPPLDEPARRQIARDLANTISGEVRFGAHDRMLYATDASLYQVEPIGVVVPADIEDAVRAVRFCSEHNLPILPRGGGTSLAGQCTNRAVVIDFSAHCRKILTTDATLGQCTVEPGISIDDLNDQLASTGCPDWFFAPDPATSKQCNIGGAIGNNAAGARSIKYGRTSESLLGLDVMLADTTRLCFEQGASLRDARVNALTRRIADIILPIAPIIRERFPKTIRRNAGYALDMVLSAIEESPADLARVNLAHLVCGSEGTLAVTLAAHLKLHKKPKAKGLAVLGFSDIDQAIASVIPILSTSPSAVELLDDMVIGLAAANAEYRRYVDLMPAPASGPLKAVLYVEYFSDQPGPGGLAEIQDRFDALRRTVPGVALHAHTNAQAMLSAWKLRKAGEPLLHGVAGDRKPLTFIEDNAIPVERLSEFVKRLRAIVTRHGTTAAYWAHASVGVLHVRPLVDIHSNGDREIMRSIAVETADLARELGGVMSGEHGDGRVRGPLLERFFGPEIMRAFRDIKTIFDPRNLLNPGNIVEPRPIESITRTLRVEPLDKPVAAPNTSTYFDYSDQHGFNGAVEMCNGAGVCRKKSGGTMCPSYQATLDERHSTRGRGNALRLAITGQLSDDAAPRWNDAETIKTLNLCLSCKACKTECPSNVDISRLKAEYTAQRYRQAGGPPLSALMFGHVRVLNRLGSIAPGIANWMNRTRLAKWALKGFANIDPRRDIPAFSRSLARDFAPSLAQTESAKPRVALFGDCFTMYNEPGIGRAVKRVYEALGYTISLANAGCCGRAMISTGLLPQAADMIDATLARLKPFIEDASVRAILVAEPSCLSAIKDDWLQLRLQTPLALRKELAAKSFLPEEFLSRGWDDHPTKLDALITAPAAPVILHAHCHQKALFGSETSSAIIKRLLGEGVTVLDTGCCGMAGSFGYTADRYDLSMKIGALTLFPAVNAAPAATLCAPGTSCRHQIHDGTGRSAMHPIEFIAQLLV
ncbi:MAG: FAD-linked oxidase C-terminal domain-containing protein [Planctomycetota bacterium]